ncbi:MAG: ArsR/SmtB family transcription factor [Micavibrio sp.]
MGKIRKIEAKAESIAAFLKGFASPSRLLILCQLSEGEKNVSELIRATGIAQTSMSQHLSKLRAEGLVDYRRDHRTLYYFIFDDTVKDILTVLYERFCGVMGN